jgi:S-DNA-T family DNA segregation ATPase FtsK/SpoIIIE
MTSSQIPGNRRPAGLLTPTRQQLWLRGIADRCRQGQRRAAALAAEQQRAAEQLERQLADSREQTIEECRRERRAMLDRWDHSDETLISQYEQQTLDLRDQRNRELVRIKRIAKHERGEEAQRHALAIEQLKVQYSAEQPKAAAWKQHALARISELAQACQEELARAAEFVSGQLGASQLARLAETAHESSPAAVGEDGEDDEASRGGLRAVDPQESESLEQFIHELEALQQSAAAAVTALMQSRPARWTRPLPLLGSGLTAALLWSAGVFWSQPERPALWIFAAVPVGVAAGLLVRLSQFVPLRREAQQTYPRAAAAAAAMEVSARRGRGWVTQRSAQRAEQLKEKFEANRLQLQRQHNERRAALEKQQTEQLEQTAAAFAAKIQAVEDNFRSQFAATSRDLFGEAEQIATRLNARLERDRAAAERRRRDQQQQARQSRLEHWQRLHGGLRGAFDRAAAAEAWVAEQTPAWQSVLAGELSTRTRLPGLPLGSIRIDEALRRRLDGAATEAGSSATEAGSSPDRSQVGEADFAGRRPRTLPLMLVRGQQPAVLIDCPPEQMEVAASTLRGALWRALTAVAPGRLRLTLIDPAGRGQHFDSLVALGDYDPPLINHRAWSQPQQIAARLTELTQHVEDLLQTCLRDRYRLLEDFNAEAGALAEPYHVIAAMGIPAGWNQEASEALRALLQSGQRCGVFLLLVRDLSQAWPEDFAELDRGEWMRLRIDTEGRVWHLRKELDDLPIEPIEPPPSQISGALAQRIGTAARDAGRVEVPLDDCLRREDFDTADSAEGLEIPVGRQGAGRTSSVSLGAGMRQHVLIAGKTGSGKSTLLHALITSAASLYPPEQLHLYLLDFKKGVEFKIYADEELPHARVIGIESEREFGHSVLQRLDEELQRRGEAFRAAGVQELSEFRRRSAVDLPRILLVVDEFQELFTHDDRLAGECAGLLDRLVRQGRSFGMHVVLSSQSLAGAQSLPRTTLGQMAVRIALQCSEADASLILADENPAARLLSRPGEAIYNDAGGLVEGNQPFQAARIAGDAHRTRLREIAARHGDAVARFGAPVIFEGNRPARWSEALAEAALVASTSTEGAGPQPRAVGLLGEAVRIGPPSRLALSDNTGRNVLCVADPEAALSVLGIWLSSAWAAALRRYGAPPRLVLLEAQRAGGEELLLSQWLGAAGVACQTHAPRDCETVMRSLLDDLSQRAGEAAGPPTWVVVTPLERFRDLRQDDAFGFSLDGAAATTPASALQTLLRDGPQAGIHCWLACGGAETLVRWLPRASHHDLELRILGRVSAADSSQLIDTPVANNLAPATMLRYDDSDGSLEKFRLCGLPDPAQIRRWLDL